MESLKLKKNLLNEYFSRQYFQTIISDLRYIENLKEENNQLYSKYIQIQDDNLKIYYENTYYDRDISSGISYVIKNKKKISCTRLDSHYSYLQLRGTKFNTSAPLRVVCRKLVSLSWSSHYDHSQP